MSTHLLFLFALLALVLLLSRPTMPMPMPSPDDDDKISCAEIVVKVTPCLDYITGKSAQPSQKCCEGLKDISGTIANNRKDACECIKKTLSKIKYDSSRIPSLPKQCGLSFNLPPITNSTDCSKVFVS